MANQETKPEDAEAPKSYRLAIQHGLVVPYPLLIHMRPLVSAHTFKFRSCMMLLLVQLVFFNAISNSGGNYLVSLVIHMAAIVIVKDIFNSSERHGEVMKFGA